MWDLKVLHNIPSFIVCILIAKHEQIWPSILLTETYQNTFPPQMSTCSHLILVRKPAQSIVAVLHVTAWSTLNCLANLQTKSWIESYQVLTRSDIPKWQLFGRHQWWWHVNFLTSRTELWWDSSSERCAKPKWTQITRESGHAAGMERDMTVLSELDSRCLTAPCFILGRIVCISFPPLCTGTCAVCIQCCWKATSSTSGWEQQDLGLNTCCSWQFSKYGLKQWMFKVLLVAF